MYEISIQIQNRITQKLLNDCSSGCCIVHHDESFILLMVIELRIMRWDHSAFGKWTEPAGTWKKLVFSFASLNFLGYFSTCQLELIKSHVLLEMLGFFGSVLIGISVLLIVAYALHQISVKVKSFSVIRDIWRFSRL